MPFAPGSVALKLLRWYSSVVGEWDGVSVMAEDWDTLVLLDACRYDMFERISELPGDLSMCKSQASATDDFLRENFSEGPFHDTVYVTANPRLETVDDVKSQFHDVINVWQSNWDADLETVPPGPMTTQVIAAHERYPDKRIIAHYIQPHGPFIGPTGIEEIGVYSGVADHKRTALGEESDPDNKYVWELVRQGVVTGDVAKRAYDENLALALAEVERLLEAVKGRIVVTSDHGNMLGERAWPVPVRLWGHPNGIRTDELVNVPWLVYESGPRRDIIAEELADEQTAATDNEVEERLRSLGYA